MGSTFQSYQHNSKIPRAWLYRVVFRQGLLGATLAALLLLLMLLQPLQPLYAAEPDVATEEATETTETTETDEGGGSETAEETAADSKETESVAEPDTEEDLTAADDQSAAETSTVEEDGSRSDESDSPEAEEVVVAEESESNTDDASLVDDVGQNELSEPATTSVPVDTSSSSPTSGEEEDVATTTVDDNASTSTATTSIDSPATTRDAVDGAVEDDSDEPGTDPATSESDTAGNDSDSINTDPDDDSSAESVSENPASTPDTEELADPDPDTSSSASSSNEVVVETALTSHVSDANRHQFSAEECIVVGDGSYYCSAAEEVEVDIENDIVYSKRNADGYSEIYLQTAQGEQQITDNQYDDSAPHYDQQSASIVWHRDIDGRYQIMSYDLSTKEITQITNTSAHNMQPTRAGKYTVWQRWANGHWQVILAEAEVETPLTNQRVHNVAPYVYGNYVIWNTTSSLGEPKIAVYDIATELISYITNDEGGRVRNPRFVLVYDTELANGDVLTQGFDPETGETEPLSSVPAAPLPDIPSPDPVGETRALLPQKTASSSEDKVTKQSSDDEEAADPEVATSTVSVKDTASSTVDMTASTTAAAELSEYDLVVTPYSTTTASTSQVSAQETISEEQ